ncbi:MAG: hypothetical protein E7098_02210 [Mediterranea massiliensis]|nr:hypothetical protein [Mediterranea massiliensis]
MFSQAQFITPILKTNMPVVPSQYWSIAHGTSPGEVAQDEEGMQTSGTADRDTLHQVGLP